MTLRVVGDDLTAERVIPTSRNHTYLRDNTQRAVFDHPAPANYKLEEVAGMSVAEFIESLDLNKK
ncbi:hypothetical protein JOD43_003915 [Pullulanibacillus pueri]|uniref:hypothetical protein n=1 Tax=Pullulanibacillus pueri TaxID=1437324 RepID=UPI00166B52EB|nr:hypothetical protein [Pullulanibacillus pueri]MBM7683735.1 hypothetical protein [Pullulanibacillus pueri]